MKSAHNRYVSETAGRNPSRSKLELVTVYSHCDLPSGSQLDILNAFWFL